MTLKEKIYLQASATNKVFLFKEGIFYKVYNQGVFLLKECNYKVSVKQSAKTKLWYVSIGFPESVLEKLKLSYTFIKEQANNTACFATPTVFENEAYTNWKTQQITTSSTIKKEQQVALNDKTLIEQLKNYPLANKTPIEVFMWVAAMQQKLKDQ